MFICKTGFSVRALHWHVPGLLRGAALAVLLAFSGAPPAVANSDPLLGLLSEEGSAGLGLATRMEQSRYRGGGTRYDLVPLYLYEGDVLYLHSYRIGLKFDDKPERRFDVFLSHRFEGYPYDRIPASLAGMEGRDPGMDLGTSYQRRGPWGNAYIEYLRDVSGNSHGSEVRLGYGYEWRSGRLRLRPTAMLAARSAKLNDYYYGVRPDEAAPGRPAYAAGSGVNRSIGLYASYELSRRWRLLAGATATRWSDEVRRSPIVDERAMYSGFLGFVYDVAPEHKPWQDRTPVVVKLLHGNATDCNLVATMRLSCASTRTVDGTRVNAIEIGRPFVERLNGWPVDVVGYVGALHHNERGLQQDFWQVNAYMKGFFYGFPWSDRLRTRIGFGAGVSWAQKIPFVEARDQAARGRNSSKLLSYLDPSIDVSVGDLVGARSLRETYAGFGVSHRSGIFGSSQLLGNVNGGSNYIYTYVESRF